MKTNYLLRCILFCTMGVSVCNADWFEDFESYDVIGSDDIIFYIMDGNFWQDKPGVLWERYGETDYFAILDPSDDFSGSPLYSTYVPNVGSNNTKMLWELWYGTYAWFFRPLGSVAPLDTVTVTGEVAIAGASVHTAWPFANHIMVGGVAIGIAGNSISYGRISAGQAPAGEPSPDPANSLFTPVGAAIAANTWYEIKIVYYQMPGESNDVASLYYRQKGTSTWQVAAENFETNSDLGTDVYVVGQNGPKEYLGFIDNINVVVTPKECGDFGTPNYSIADINKDCHVDFRDFALCAEGWNNCTDPANIECSSY